MKKYEDRPMLPCRGLAGLCVRVCVCFESGLQKSAVRARRITLVCGLHYGTALLHLLRHLTLSGTQAIGSEFSRTYKTYYGCNVTSGAVVPLQNIIFHL